MDTPICDFVKKYTKSNFLRLHMPGHKGCGSLGAEQFDITEVDGADSLYEADGIIKQSEQNASRLFGCKTFYSTEGSSQCIRAMLYLAMLKAKQEGKAPPIFAARNAHKTFLSAAALLDLEVEWLYPETADNYLCCDISAEGLEQALSDAVKKPTAVYITSPDYLGNVADVASLAEVCHKYGALLLVDNAHGAYLKFLPKSQHPIDLGADLCCDSAHKTLPVLTGGAYLHLSEQMDKLLGNQAKNALALFGSTSPSYLIMQSLDAANAYLCDYPQKLSAFIAQVEKLKDELTAYGFILRGGESLKITVSAKDYGYTGKQIADLLLRHGIVSEFSDPDYIVLMLTPETGEAGLEKLKRAMFSISPKSPIKDSPPKLIKSERVISIRDAALSAAEILPTENCHGRILAAATVGCPPAVPILVCGERIDSHSIECFKYYGIQSCSAVKK
ncbi:MAG: aminotransferase class I/II-fold pyridoxal phosphate-dependent enzyme [Oscillospiraceae bacterium]|nr:aminotransferase class I/II-fold pyridoxal phosphate-dependent enzyme [Oscillospiraceae bacterium]